MTKSTPLFVQEEYEGHVKKVMHYPAIGTDSEWHNEIGGIRPGRSFMPYSDGTLLSARPNLAILSHFHNPHYFFEQGVGLFYPLAGRLRSLKAGRLELDCNGEGVVFTEVDCEDNMEVLGDFSPSPKFHHLIPNVDYSTPVEDMPLVLLQVTKFRCGGICLGITISHAIADGQSAAYFICEWASLARGEPIGKQPVLDKRLLRAGEPPSSKISTKKVEYKPPPFIVGEKDTQNERKKETTAIKLVLSKAQVEILQATTNESLNKNPKPYSRYEAIAAHIWRCTSSARRHVHDQLTGFTICVDIRNRLNPKLPKTYFGNAIVDVMAQCLSGELTMKPLSFAASKIREAINSVTSDYVNSYIDFLKRYDDFSPLQDIHAMRSGQGPFYGNPNISVVSWLRLPLYEVDFGWGREIFMGPGTYDCDGDSLLMPAEDGGVVVAICLQEDCMVEFKRLFFKDLQKFLFEIKRYKSPFCMIITYTK